MYQNLEMLMHDNISYIGNSMWTPDHQTYMSLLDIPSQNHGH